MLELGSRLGTIHNLHYYQRLMEDIRAAIDADELPDLLARLRAMFGPDAKYL